MCPLYDESGHYLNQVSHCDCKNKRSTAGESDQRTNLY